MAAITLERVRKEFGGVTAVAGASLDVRDGEWFVIAGPPGAGKSTLVRLVSGHDVPTSGRVLFGGLDVTEHPPETRHVQVVRPLSAVPRTGPSRWFHHQPPEPPAIEQLRAALSSAAGRGPRLAAVLADEPFAGLEPTPRATARAELQRLHRQVPVTVLHASSDQGDAVALAHRLAVLIDGVVAQVGTPLQVYERPATAAVASFIGAPGINLIAGRVELRQREPAFVAGGRVLAMLPPGAAVLDGRPVTLGVRPPDVVISPNGRGLDGTVESVEPAGPQQTVRATLADGWPLTLVAPARPSIAPGAYVRVALRPDRLHLFGPDGRRFVAADPPPG